MLFQFRQPIEFTKIALTSIKYYFLKILIVMNIGKSDISKKKFHFYLFYILLVILKMLSLKLTGTVHYMNKRRFTFHLE
ncbi:MAG TPA: hypothetical protein DCX05_06445 [Prevotella sp.]|nr:hypothetical protein [Prevotella sp.]